ncbi:MAG: alpha/beta hydrolase [Promethearchaeota archaeon]
MEKKSILDNPLVSHTLFYPRRTPIPKETDPNIKVLKFQIEKDILIGGFVYLNDLNLPTVLLFHGNGEVAADYQGAREFFYRCGVNLAVVDYRGYGFSSGEPFYTSLIIDALPIYNAFYTWIIKNRLKNSIFILGRSLGSICASEIGSHNPESLRGVIFESGFASIHGMMTRLSGQEIEPEFFNEYSNDVRIRKFKKPVLVIHGTMDQIIPYQQGKLIFENVPPETDKKLVLIKGAGHNTIFYFEDEYIPSVKEFIEKFQ